MTENTNQSIRKTESEQAKKDIAEFIQPLDHEFTNVATKLTEQGYKIDGDNGIKKHCDLHNLKSADYFYVAERKNNRFYVLEFSDLLRQREQIAQVISELKQSDLDKSTRTTLVKEQHKKMTKELVEKYKDSLHIVNQIDQYLTQIPDSFSQSTHHYLIVVPPLDSLPIEQAVVLAKILDEIKNKVTQAIPEQLYTSVSLITLDKFIKR